MQKSDAWARDPLILGLAVILAITFYRLVMLSFSTADLFVDETQYWLWGQTLDWGYYSKPPLIGWVIRAVTDIAGSDSAFWIRMPGAVFHATTAVLLIGAASEVTTKPAAVVVGCAYVTMPFASVGASLISTDTILLPFFAAAMWLWLRLVRGPSGGLAILLGLCLGLGFLAKYAALYFVICAAIGAWRIPQARIAWRDLLLAAIAFAIVIAPNIIWNLQNDLVTINHTADNANWVGEAFALNPDRALGFFSTQFGVVGPVFFTAYLWAVWAGIRHADWRMRLLVALSFPILLLVLGQALLDRAYANWAVTAYVAATVLTVALLWQSARVVLALGLAINIAIAVAIPVLSSNADRWMARDGERLLLRRYVGRADTSARILSEAQAQGIDTLVATHRDILADLFYAARDSDLSVFSTPPVGPPDNYYAQRYALQGSGTSPVLFVSFDAASQCSETPLASWNAGPAYRNRTIYIYRTAADCWAQP
ncbi:MAG: glycosyltransferase family 39 protein [Pseudomonadota bacterium]